MTTLHADKPLPISYEIHHHTQTCVCCHKTHTHSDLYARMDTTKLDHRGKPTHLHALSWPTKLYNLPIHTVHCKPTTIPFCHTCYFPSLAHFDSPPMPIAPAPTRSNILSTTPPARPAAPRPTTPTNRPSVADILAQL